MTNLILQKQSDPHRQRLALSCSFRFQSCCHIAAGSTTLLFCRVEDRRGHSHLCVARSQNGIDKWQIDPQPTLLPDPENFSEELWGIKDRRITYVPELGQYAIVYTAFNRDGPGVALALTKDFHSGSTIATDGDTLSLYYGAADTSIALATARIRELFDWLEKQ